MPDPNRIAPGASGIIGYVCGAGGLLSSLVMYLSGLKRNKTDERIQQADAAQAMTQDLLHGLQGQVTSLLSEVVSLQGENRQLRAEMIELRKLNAALSQKVADMQQGIVAGAAAEVFQHEQLKDVAAQVSEARRS